MMRRRVVIPALLLASMAMAPTFATAQYGGVKLPAPDASQRFTTQQIDNLTGPVALYPDALLAQVLVAATFPEQVEDAAQFVRQYGTDSVDTQPWDVSVKAVAHYPSALNSLADKIDWTTALGKAYAIQSSDVMASVQRLRKMAADQGNLNSTPQQNVVTTNDTYQIVPVEPRVIYVPVYDPYVIYSRPVFAVGYNSRWFSWGVGFPIGDWLIYDCDWGLRRVYYNGWSPSFYAFGGGWRQRSRPFIHVTNIYVNTRYTNVYVNRNVVSRSINYYNVDRYASVHGGRHFEGRGDGRYDRDDRYAVRRDDDDRGGAVRGEGYRNGGSSGGVSQQGPSRGNGNGNSGNGNSGNGNRPGSTRDGSGYGNDRGDAGNGSNAARPRAPESRRNEPAIRTDDQQVLMPERRAQPKARVEDQPVYVPQRRAEPPSGNQGQVIVPERRAEQPVYESRSAPEQRAHPQQREHPRAEQPRVEQPRVEQQRSEPRAAQPAVIRPERSRPPEPAPAPARTARPRGGR